MQHFAEPSVQSTLGSRGKTTRRRSTKTVRGPEGSYCAQIADHIAERPAGWTVRIEVRYSRRMGELPDHVSVYDYGRFDTQEEAETHAAGKLASIGVTMSYPMHDCTILRAWVELK